ncbi:MAG: c-type cytochrome [Bacteroidales bacterium]|jgi:cytochrome c peroxidase|nr:c-type cytochrome [Bacteroidales bacterium]
MKSAHYLLVLCLVSSLIFLGSNCRKPEEEYQATPYQIEIPRFFPTILNIPDDNPMTVEGIELGRHLFYEEHLCGYRGTNPDSLMSCATCHQQRYGFEVGMNNPRYPNGQTCGLTGVPTPHAILPLINLVFNSEGYFWNGMIYADNPQKDRRTLEDIVKMGIVAPHEMNGSYDRTVNAIKSIPKYAPLFKKAFGTEEITMDRIAKAIAQFVRTLISANSKFDRYLLGSENLTPQELNGYVLFTTEQGGDCFHCHGGGGTPLFTTNLFYNNALTNTFNDPRDRYAVTNLDKDHGAYRAPTLRNIAVTAPYMHDGRFLNLDEVLEFYNSGLVNSPYVHPLMHKINDGGNRLTPSQISDLKAFLNTLTDDEFLNSPRFTKPE